MKDKERVGEWERGERMEIEEDKEADSEISLLLSPLSHSPTLSLRLTPQPLECRILLTLRKEVV